MILHNDEPTLSDRLDRVRLVAEVGDAIAKCQPPQVLGVHGDWGLGKTSFLHQLHYYLAGDCPQQDEQELKHVEDTQLIPKGVHEDQVRVVWFEAWRYQHETAPVIALLQEMRSQLEWYLKFGKQLKKTLAVGVRGALLSMEDLTKKIGFQASKIEKAGEDWERRNLAVTLPSHTIREQLQIAIGGLLVPKSRGQEKRVVVLIDDLDRCESDAAYRLLEGLKIYLTLPNCVFVLGMNQRIVEDAISRHLPQAEDGQKVERAAAYLEKLCQNVWRLPAVRNTKSALLDWLPDEHVNKVVQDWIAAALGDDDCLPPNPRRLKGFANLLYRFKEFLPRQDGDSDDAEMIEETRLMLVVAYVYQFHHDLFRIWEHEPEFYEAILQWVRSGKKKTDIPAIDRMKQSVLLTADESDPVPSGKFDTEKIFPDPSDSNVFWIQPLVHQLGDIEPSRFKRYLHAVHSAGTGE